MPDGRCDSSDPCCRLAGRGLTVSYEKLVTDMEVLQMVAEMCAETSPDSPETNLGALAEVAPGGHFFAAQHTMARYQTEFYEPLVADWANFGTWSERGEKTASQRATGIWQEIVATDPELGHDGARIEALRSFIETRSAAGGALPES